MTSTTGHGATHTPGPWVQYERNALIIVDKDGASLGDMTPGDPYISNAEALANAKLVVSAPDLLAALDDVVRRFEKQLAASGKYIPAHIYAAHEIALANARAAIAKAAP